jgi:hypothetical protein
MKDRRWLILLASLGVILLASSVGGIMASFVDQESSSNNTFEAWASVLWQQTTQADFEAGVLNNTDTSSSAGDVKLAVRSDWYNASWQYRRAITIDHTKVQDVANPSTTYANFPVLVYATGLSNIKADGADIRFTLSDGITELPREIESYSGGTLYAWVKFTLTKDAGDSSNDVIYMYYGNAAATEPAPNSPYGSQNVWDSNYKGVWHLKEATGANVADSTSNGHTGTQNNSPTQTAGQIDGSLNFNGTNQYIQTTSNESQTASNITWSCWFKTSSTAFANHLLWEGIADGNGWGPNPSDSTEANLSFGHPASTNNVLDFYLGNADVTTQAGTISISYSFSDTSNWHYVVVVVTDLGSSPAAMMYVDGSSGGSDTGTTTYTSRTGWNTNLMLANCGANTRYYQGLLDEVHVSVTARSADWIKTEYNNQNSPSTFCSLGGEVGRYVSPGTIASRVLDTGVSGARWDALFWDETLPSNTDITFEVRASDTLFAKNATTPNWIDLGLANSPITSGLPSGQYKQWRATLNTSDTSETPTLHEVRVWHY